MSEHRPEFTRFEPDETLIPANEKGDKAPEGTQFVVGPDGKIAFVGSPTEVDAWARARRDEGAQVRVEQGGVVLPGLTDTHYHPALFSSIGLARPIDVSKADSPRAFARMVEEGLRERAAALKPGQPLVVTDFDSGQVGKLSEINLDEVVPDRPLFVLDRSYHGGAANTRGGEFLRAYLRQNYGDRTFPGSFRKGQFTETYVLLALELAESFENVDRLEEAIEQDIEGYLGKGVTGIHEMDVTTWNQFMSYLLLRRKWGERGGGDEFPVRRMFLSERLLERLTREQDALVRSGLFDQELQGMLGVKFYADGAFGSETALVSEAYHTSHKHGVTVTRMKEAEAAMRQLLTLGGNKVATHAIGDEGIARAMKFAQRWRKLAEGRGVEPQVRFEHFELPLGDSVRKAKDLGAWASLQSNFAVEDAVYTDRLGERTRMLCPHADLANEGVPMMLGSDGMPKSMLYVIWSAMHHPDQKQRLDLISAVTAASAAAGAHEGSLRGVLKPGSKTEIVVANPAILQAFADGRRADEYIAQAMRPRGERRDVPIRDQVGELEQHLVKVFRQGRVVWEAQKL